MSVRSFFKATAALAAYRGWVFFFFFLGGRRLRRRTRSSPARLFGPDPDAFYFTMRKGRKPPQGVGANRWCSGGRISIR